MPHCALDRRLHTRPDVLYARLSRLARRGQAVDPSPRPCNDHITLTSCTLGSWSSLLLLDASLPSTTLIRLASFRTKPSAELWREFVPCATRALVPRQTIRDECRGPHSRSAWVGSSLSRSLAMSSPMLIPHHRSCRSSVVPNLTGWSYSWLGDSLRSSPCPGPAHPSFPTSSTSLTPTCC